MILHSRRPLGVRIGEVLFEVPKHSGAQCARDRLHRLVGSEQFLSLFVLQLLLLELGLELRNHLWPGHLLPLLGADDLGQLGGHVELHLDNYQELYGLA